MSGNKQNEQKRMWDAIGMKVPWLTFAIIIMIVIGFFGYLVSADVAVSKRVEKEKDINTERFLKIQKSLGMIEQALGIRQHE